jgi:hypothetical protein
MSRIARFARLFAVLLLLMITFVAGWIVGNTGLGSSCRSGDAT